MGKNYKRLSEGWVHDLCSWQTSSDLDIGHCVLTVGTDAKTTLKIKGVKLLPSHAYAVVGELSKVISSLTVLSPE